MNDISITSKDGVTSVTINGDPIPGVIKAEVLFSPKDVPLLRLDMVAKSIKIDADGKVTLNQPHRSWTRPEEQRLVELYKSYTIAEVARRLGRTRASVDTKLRELRRREDIGKKKKHNPVGG